MANFALVILIFLSASAHASTTFDMSSHSGFIRDSLGNYSQVSANGSVRTLTSNTALAIVEKPIIQTSKGALEITLNRTAAVDVARIGKSMGAFAMRVGPVGMSLTAVSLVCELSNICNQAGEWFTGDSVSLLSSTPSCSNVTGTGTYTFYSSTYSVYNKYKRTKHPNCGGSVPSGWGVVVQCADQDSAFSCPWGDRIAKENVGTPVSQESSPHAATPEDFTAKESQLNDDRFTPELFNGGEKIPITTPQFASSPVAVPIGTTTKTLKDGSGTVTGSETDTTSLSITDGAINETPNVINITETTIHNVYNNSNVLQSSTTTTTDPQQPAPESKADPLEIKFDTVNDTPLTEKVVTAPFTTTSWGGGECPADIAMNLTRGNFSIDSQPFCDFAIALKPLLLLVAALAGAYIVITSTRPTT